MSGATDLKGYAYVVVLAFGGLNLFAGQSASRSGEISLPTSKHLTVPSPGYLAPLNGFAAAICISPDGNYAAILNDGYGAEANQSHQSIIVINLKTNELTEFPEERLAEESHQSYFIGLVFSSDGSHLYASVGSISDPTGEKPGDTGNGIAVYRFDRGEVAWERFIPIAPQKISPHHQVAFGLRNTTPGTAIPYPAGIAVISRHGEPDKLLIANNLSDNAVLLDSRNGRTLEQFDLSTHDTIPSSFPYSCVAARDGRRAWCSLWNASRLAELDLDRGTVTRWISLLEPKDPTAPGSHPTALLLSPNEKILYVALSNADKIAAISTDAAQVLSLINTKLPGQTSAGTYPSALAQSADGKRLFVADSSLNAVEVLNTASLVANGIQGAQPIEGFIPTDWYPSALATFGDDLLVATAKGRGTGPNNGPAQNSGAARRRSHPYIASLLYGSVARIDFRTAEKHLPELTSRVEASNLIASDPGRFHFQQGSNPVRHVIYILKENRTYDQILGDLKVGNGDSSMTLYGADITPNEHKLALQFGVLDNFYDSGEVSGDGHDWSTAAITTDYNEKTWQIAYRGRERTYDYGGTVADELPLEEGEPDVDAPSTGYLWDNLSAHGMTYRGYGDYIATVWCKSGRAETHSPKEGTPSPLSAVCPRSVVKKGEPLPKKLGGSLSNWPWPVPLFSENRATKSALRGHFDASFPNFNTEYPDQWRADEFLREFDGFVRSRKHGKGTELPSFVLLYLPNDHTHGTAAGAPRPAASVADNDLAVGRVVEAVSHSSYWEDTAIFVVEDDAQNGADHVDAHRSIALVISKYSPGSTEHPFVDSHFYTTVNMVHTMETLLGLPPMNQNDAYAPLMVPLFTGAGTQSPYTADWTNRDNGLIYQANPRRGRGAEISSKLDFTHPDANNPDVLNAILWRDRKANLPMPAAKHTIFAERSKNSGSD
ncbi:MAG: bifunctional YncE family protein/alkaline phosphatase family protein [Terriglobales bacterium]